MLAIPEAEEHRVSTQTNPTSKPRRRAGGPVPQPRVRGAQHRHYDAEIASWVRRLAQADDARPWTANESRRLVARRTCDAPVAGAAALAEL